MLSPSPNSLTHKWTQLLTNKIHAKWSKKKILNSQYKKISNFTKLNSILKTDEKLKQKKSLLFFPLLPRSCWIAGKLYFSFIITLLSIYSIPNNLIPIAKISEDLENLNTLIHQTERTISLIAQQFSVQATERQKVDFAQLPNLTQQGQIRRFTWSKQTLLLNRTTSFPSKFYADVYLPKVNRPAPVIVLSYGLNGNRNSFAHLAKQLASHGFAVAIPDNPTTNTQKNQILFKGLTGKIVQPEEFITRASNVKFLLDELQRRSQSDPSFQINLQQVGAIGHSFGGYTVLALAGATLNLEQLRADCVNANPLLNLSLILQCQAIQLPHTHYNLRDPRIKAVIAINPVGSSIFGKVGISKIQVPIMLISSSNDTLTPALKEHILPFTWLAAKDKYLATINGGTHFSTVSKNNPFRNPLIALVCNYIDILSVAFLQNYIAGAKEYKPYLSASYAQAISQNPLKLNLLNSLNTSQLEQAFIQSRKDLNQVKKLQNIMQWAVFAGYENFRDFLDS